MRVIQSLFAAAAIGCITSPALAVPILPGNTTDITVTWSSLVAQAGLTQSLSGDATVAVVGQFPVVSLPITGGFTNPDGTWQIRHDGSGISVDSPTVSAALTNLVFDTSTNVVLSEPVVNGVSVSPELFPAFNIGPGQVLTLTTQDAAALDAVFNTNLFTSATVVGTFATNPILTAVPEPSTVTLFVVGLVGVVGLSRLRRRELRTYP